MNTKQMLIFKHFVEYQNENMVAEKLNITQPTVTFHLKNLNQRYGTPLYHKKGKHFKLTEAGELLFRNSNKLLYLMQETEDILEDYRQSKRSTLKIGASHAPVYHILPHILKNYLQAYPHIQIDLIVDTAPNIIEKLRHREIEIGVISEKGFYDDDIKVKRFTDNPLMVAMDCHHPLAAQEHLTLTDITQYPFILHSGGSTRQSIEEWQTENFVDLPVRMQANSVSSILEMLKDADYLSLISERALSNNPYITAKTLPHAPAPRHISLIYREDQYMTPIIQNFISLMYES
ncbi:LysR family transcriptional regulator [Staphylococcus lugdunensis]|uniref:LysR family transcriptional regulator n=1 Tax=Staphylococcus lugdunensis TaxID=28035 RepID=UPI002096226B|nr:LysR family transcriptional regulator [Staphylococcus lugdunensis]MCO6596404.1 LysR family transcriptional regulator [Staphylococcus lugdunensis]